MGGLRPGEQITLTKFFAALRCATFDAEIGRKAGDYLRQFRNSHGVELADALIAATASVSGTALWTRNRKHYPMKDLSFFLRQAISPNRSHPPPRRWYISFL